MKRVALVTLSATLLAGCSVGHKIDQATAKYDLVENQIQLGDSKERVLAALLPSQEGVPRNSRKKPDRYIKDGVAVEIHYMRTGRQADGLTTDDEFTPYIFNDGSLVGIGWGLIGGPNSQGQTTGRTTVNTTTIVY
jgi:hypothetical protein